MPSSERAAAGLFRALVAACTGVAIALASSLAWADAAVARGFALDRFSPSAAGAGWFAMDALDMRGGLGGAAQLTASWAHDPLRVTAGDGSKLAVVSNEVFLDYGFAATYDRFRLSLSFGMPLVIKGESGASGGYAFQAPSVDLGSHPDTLMDARLGVDARLLGDAASMFRLGLGAHLFFPNQDREDYVTDGTFRGLVRLLFAGDIGWFSYAGHGGVHLRPLSDAPAPGSPRGSELVFGLAAGVVRPLGPAGAYAFVVGPELIGETAIRSALGASTTGLEGLLTARIEGTEPGAQLRVKAGAGGGLHAQFGAPEWRAVLAVEVFQRGR